MKTMKSNFGGQYGRMSRVIDLELSPDTVKRMNSWLEDIVRKNLMEERRKKINKIRNERQ
jgi:hypothetical protein